MGISAKAAEPEAAEKLVEFLFSKEGQETGASEGFPVNEAVMTVRSTGQWEMKTEIWELLDPET